MKKIWAVILLSLCVPLSCYLNNTDDSRVGLSITNPFPPGVVALHVAVYEGVPGDTTLLQYQVFFPGSTVSIVVPGGTGRIFTVWAQDMSGAATYYGASDPMTIEGNSKVDVSVKMKKFTDTTAPTVMSLVYNSNANTLTWNLIYGADQYEAQGRDAFGKYVPAYSGPGKTCDVGTLRTPYQVRAYSALFNLYSVFTQQ